MTQFRPASIWRLAIILTAFALATLPVIVHAQENVAIIHYHRPDDAYAGWGLHVWGDAMQETQWDDPLPPTGEDEFGPYWRVPLEPGAQVLGFIIHQGEVKDPGPDMLLDLTISKEAWVVTHTPQVYTEAIHPAEIVTGMAESSEPAPPPQVQPPVAASGSTNDAANATADDGSVHDAGWGVSQFMRPGVWKSLSLDAAGLVILARTYDDGVGIVAFNFWPMTQTATLDVSSLSPIGSVWVDSLGDGASSASEIGVLAFEVAPLGFRIWLTGDTF